MIAEFQFSEMKWKISSYKPSVPVITRQRDIDSRWFILRRIFYKIPKIN